MANNHYNQNQWQKNHLEAESSPYLLQHKDNPIWWFPWGQEAFSRAQELNRPIFLSVGYSTCHWCHVMEKDSFETQEVAKILNQSFISIKVDREERPDVDDYYMTAVQAMTKRGGWPMSVLLTSEGVPFWGGTFIPKENFLGLLTEVARVWAQDSQSIGERSSDINQFLQQAMETPKGSGDYNPQQDFEKEFWETFLQRFDSQWGGFLGGPKFPQSLSLMVLLRYHQQSKNPKALEAVTQTLEQMRRGGMYDHVGGGFFRYSTDDHWRIPHFEKMLYDNALLTTTYLEAYQYTKNTEFLDTAQETLDYILRDMTHEKGPYYSAEDADSEHIEGKFYVWDMGELKKLLASKEYEKIVKTFGLTEKGNFHAHKTGDEVTEKRNGPPAIEGNNLFLDPGAQLPHSDLITSALEKMLTHRTKRVRPHLDDKFITSWNGLMISSMALGFRVSKESKYLKSAQKAGEYFLNRFEKDGKLSRTYRKEDSKSFSLADDYALLAQGILDLYETDFEPKWFSFAQDLVNQQLEMFWDSQQGGFFRNDGSDKNLAIRKKDFEDGVRPSSNGVSALNLLRLYSFTGQQDYSKKALKILDIASPYLKKYPQSAPTLVLAHARSRLNPKEVAIVSDIGSTEAKQFLSKLRPEFAPSVSIALGTNGNQNPLLKGRPQQDGKPTFYICQNKTCKFPTTDPNEAFSQLRN